MTTQDSTYTATYNDTGALNSPKGTDPHACTTGPCTEAYEEVWLPVVGRQGAYEVSDLGRVRSVDRSITTIRGGARKLQGRILRATPVRGYPYVKMGRRGANRAVHRIVLEAFIGPCPAGMECLHADGNRLNPRLSNLRWGTHAENMADMVAHGNSSFGARCPFSKTTDEDVELIRTKYIDGAKESELAAEHELGVTNIRLILRGCTWRHLDKNTMRRCSEAYAGRDNLRRGEMQTQSKLTEDDVLRIREWLNGGEAQATIASAFGVTQPLISRINCGQAWTHV